MPNRRELLRKGMELAIIWNESRETFVESEIVSSLHRDKVSEPHVRKFMQKSIAKVGFEGLTRWLFGDIFIAVCYAANVLHRPELELWYKHMVDLLEGVLAVEKLFISLQTADSPPDYVLVQDIGLQRLPAVNSNGDLKIDVTPELSIRACAEAVKVRAYHRCSCKLNALQLLTRHTTSCCSKRMASTEFSLALYGFGFGVGEELPLGVCEHVDL